MDIGDIATNNIEILEQSAVRNAIHSFKSKNKSDSIYCTDCGEEIPEQRRIAVPGCCRCIACQMSHEGNRHGY